MAQLFANNAYSALVGGLSNSATLLNLAAGSGNKFPSPTNGDYFLLTLADVSGGTESAWEIVKVTARTADALTIVRAQEGTTARAWVAGTPVDLRITAASFVGKESTDNKGVANGYAGLDAAGKVPTNQLPSYVDDVLEYANLATFPVTGEDGKIYVALNTNKTYRWSGSAYVYITSGAVDSVAGKTGVVTLVKGDVGLGNVDNTSDATKNAAVATLTNKTLTAPVINSPTGIVKGDVGLGNVDNTADANKPVSTAQQAALNLKAPLASPSFTGNVAVGATSRNAPLTDNDLSFDLAAKNNFGCTPTAGGTLTFTNIAAAAGQSGSILLVNASNYAIAKAATVKSDASLLGTISSTGTYRLSYYCDGTNVYVTTSGALS